MITIRNSQVTCDANGRVVGHLWDHGHELEVVRPRSGAKHSTMNRSALSRETIQRIVSSESLNWTGPTGLDPVQADEEVTR